MRYFFIGVGRQSYFHWTFFHFYSRFGKGQKLQKSSSILTFALNGLLPFLTFRVFNVSAFMWKSEKISQSSQVRRQSQPMETNGHKHRVGRHAEHGERLQPVREREFDGHNTYAGGLDKSEGELEYLLHANVTPFIFL